MKVFAFERYFLIKMKLGVEGLGSLPEAPHGGGVVLSTDVQRWGGHRPRDQARVTMRVGGQFLIVGGGSCKIMSSCGCASTCLYVVDMYKYVSIFMVLGRQRQEGITSSQPTSPD